MNRKILTVTIPFALLMAFFVPIVIAHSPLETDNNESIDTATVIPDPAKSWAIYSTLNKDGDAQYYTFNITAGQNIHTLLYKSIRVEDENFNPRIILMGPQISSDGNIPEEITVPSEYGAQLINNTEQKPTFEPFSPSVFVELADFTLENPAPGKYYLVVFEQSDEPKGGNYGLTVGDLEIYTVEEWILIPFSLISIYQWEGQSLAIIFAPMLASLVVGGILVAWKLKKQNSLTNLMAWLGAIAGITFIGTAATTLYQLIFAALQVNAGAEAIVTMIFALIPFLLGVLVLHLSLKSSPRVTIKKRVSFVVMGIVALFMWAGLIVGPILAISAGLVPMGKPKNAK
ncbi:MAG: hypothetical protein NWF01_11670 [Candidatus Bathyarchaeota archaeon]|nr:hypothetical protein [Candidatus Bathyarchaeota archaeon]